MTRYLMIFWFTVYCLKYRVNPSWFFQLNAPYFNKIKGIYSKWDINLLIPKVWRLDQNFDNPVYFPERYPVFVKPEWGQNSYGIYRADSARQLSEIRRTIAHRGLSYLIQDAAEESREFEVFYIRRADSPDNYGILTITEVVNRNQNRLPINGVHNEDSTYEDRTPDFSQKQLDQIWQHLNKIGHFWITRVGIKANSEEDLSKGHFHIVEINLFTPMPLNLLDPKKTWIDKTRFIKTAMFYLARCSKIVSKRKARESIFFKKLRMHYKVKAEPVRILSPEPLHSGAMDTGLAMEILTAAREIHPMVAANGQMYDNRPQLEQL